MLRLRENQRDRCRQQLAEAGRVEEQAADRVSQLNDELTRLARNMQESAGPGLVDIEHLRNVQRRLQQLKTDLQQAEEAHGAAEAEVERCRQSLLEANREVRTLEKHREQQLARHRAAAHKLEIKQFDEQAIRTGASSSVVKLRQLS